MRGDMAGNGLEGDEHGEASTAETASGERRPSVVALQSMLKKVSQSPFHNQHKDGEWSAAATDVTDDHKLSIGQNGVQEQLPSSPQKNGGNGDLARMNPAYSLVSKGSVLDNERQNTSEEVNLDSIFVPSPPEFQRSSLDLRPEVKTVENGDMFSEPKNNPFHSENHNNKQDFFQTLTQGHKATLSGEMHDVTLNSPNSFKPIPAQRQHLSNSLQLKSSDPFKGEEDNLFQAAKGEESHQSAHANVFDKSASIFVDPFKSPLDKEDDLFQSPQPVVANPFYTATKEEDDLFQTSQPKVANPFYTTPAKEADLFQADASKSEELFHVKEDKQDAPAKERELFGVSFKENLDRFSSSSTNTVDPFPSPIARDLFSGLDDPFVSTPSEKYDPFQDVSSGTSDIFQPLKDKLEMTSSDIAWNSMHSTASLKSPPEMHSDKLSSPALLKKSETPPPVPPKPFRKPQEIILTTPRGTKHDILQPTPFIQGRDLSASSSESPAEMSHVQTFKRPPKPLPRIRRPRPENSSKPEKPPKPEMPSQPIDPEPSVPTSSPKLPFRNLKSIGRRKQKTPEIKPVKPENYVVFEDILLIGQERCVDNWPDDSPQLDPDFKPSGKFKLRRESLKAKLDFDGGSSEDPDGSNGKKKDKKLRTSLLSRRMSKSKFPDNTMEGKSRTLPLLRKTSKDYFSDVHMSAGENEDEEQPGMDYKKKPPKTKVNQLFRRASTSVLDRQTVNGHSPHESKDDHIAKKSGIKKKSSIRRFSEGTALDESSGEDEEGGESREEKRKKTLKIKFVPQRGFAITLDKPNDETKGAHGHTTRKDSKENSLDEAFGAHGYTPDNKEKMLDEYEPQKMESCCSAEELESEEFNGMEDCKPKKFKHKPPAPRKPKTANGQSEPVRFSHRSPQLASSDGFAEDETTDGDFTSPLEMHNLDEQDELDICKPKKPSKLKGLKKLKHKNKGKAMHSEHEDPPGATSSDYLSEAARAEWRAAQMDEQAMVDNEDEDEDGDTDSLMEWWYTVEQWDEVPSDEEDLVLKEDESKSFTILADKVHRGLRVFNKVFTERAEVLWQSIITLHTIADDINEFHQKAKIAGITGGTTTAVGGVTAIAGLALAPFTFGASLVITAVGVGVATAGGITSASAAISDNVNNMQDRKKVEIVLQDYETHLLDIDKILNFVNQGLQKLRGHPFLRSGTQHYSEDWEIRRAVQMISLVDSPVMRATEITDTAVVSLQGLFKGIDKYFTKDSRELKKGCRKEIVGELKDVANLLNDTIVELNAIREELQEATGSV